MSGGLLGLSIVNAIFVEEMVKDNNDDLMLEISLLHDKVDALIEQIPPQEQSGSPAGWRGV